LERGWLEREATLTPPFFFFSSLPLSLSLSKPTVNTLKGGITTADRIVTVSPGYAYEITTPEGGWGMEVREREKRKG
jgi:glycogen synthase